MASSNVKFYERQKELQDHLYARERERLQLEQQLNAYLKSDQRLSKLKAAKLQSYWEQLCENEERSKTRNNQMLEQLDRIERQMHSLGERTEQLKQLKAHYMEEANKKYPEWRIDNRPAESNEALDLYQVNPSTSEQTTNDAYSHDSQIEQDHSIRDNVRVDTDQHKTVLEDRGDYARVTDAKMNISEPQAKSNIRHMEGQPEISEPVTKKNIGVMQTQFDLSKTQSHFLESTSKKESNQADTHDIPPTPSVEDDYLTSFMAAAEGEHQDVSSRSDGGKLAVSLRSVDFSPAVERKTDYSFTIPDNNDDDEIDLLGQIMSEERKETGDNSVSSKVDNSSKVVKFTDSDVKQIRIEKDRSETVSVNSKTNLIVTENLLSTTNNDSNLSQTQSQVDKIPNGELTKSSNVLQNLSSIIEYENVQSVQSNGKARPFKSESLYVNKTTIDAYKNTSAHTQLAQIRQSSMYDVGDDEEEDDSDEGDDRNLVETEYTEDNIPTAIEVHVTTLRHPTTQNANNDDSKTGIHILGKPLSPELTMQGLLRLLKCIEEDFNLMPQKNKYYQSTLPGLNLRKDIIEKANGSQSLTEVDSNLVSMVVLEQLTLITRSLCSGCILDDTFFDDSVYRTTVEPSNIRNLLSTEAQLLWDGLMTHFQELISHKIMSAHEIAAVFVPGMVAEKSAYQKQAFSFIVKILDKEEQADSDSDSTPPPLPTSPIPSLPTRRKPDDVPTLSLASTGDHNSTLRTDDDSEIIDTSLTSDTGYRFNLTGTAAYQSMLTGKKAGGQENKVVMDDDDDTDDDMEQQFHSILPNMSRHNIDHASTPKHPDISDLVSPRVLGAKDPTSLGTGEMLRAAIVKRRPAIGIDSDSDVEHNLDMNSATNEPNDDIDFDFYE